MYQMPIFVYYLNVHSIHTFYLKTPPEIFFPYAPECEASTESHYRFRCVSHDSVQYLWLTRL